MRISSTASLEDLLNSDPFKATRFCDLKLNAPKPGRTRHLSTARYPPRNLGAPLLEQLCLEWQSASKRWSSQKSRSGIGGRKSGTCITSPSIAPASSKLSRLRHGPHMAVFLGSEDGTGRETHAQRLDPPPRGAPAELFEEFRLGFSRRLTTRWRQAFEAPPTRPPRRGRPWDQAQGRLSGTQHTQTDAFRGAFGQYPQGQLPRARSASADRLGAAGGLRQWGPRLYSRRWSPAPCLRPACAPRGIKPIAIGSPSHTPAARYLIAARNAIAQGAIEQCIRLRSSCEGKGPLPESCGPLVLRLRCDPTPLSSMAANAGHGGDAVQVRLQQLSQQVLHFLTGSL